MKEGWSSDKCKALSSDSRPTKKIKMKEIQFYFSLLDYINLEHRKVVFKYNATGNSS
jgi:hypothetical protein